MASTPAFAGIPRHTVAQITTANTNRDGSGTPVLVFTPGSSGSKVEEIIIEATVTTTAGMVRIFLSADNGTTYRLFDEFLVPAITASGTAAAFRTSKKYTNLVLPVQHLLAATTNNSEVMNVHVLGGDF